MRGLRGVATMLARMPLPMPALATLPAGTAAVHTMVMQQRGRTDRQQVVGDQQNRQATSSRPFLQPHGP